MCGWRGIHQDLRLLNLKTHVMLKIPYEAWMAHDAVALASVLKCLMAAQEEIADTPDPAVAVHEGVRTPEADRARRAAPRRSVAARPQYDALAPVTVAAALTARAGRH